MRVIPVDPSHPRDDRLAVARSVLLEGGIVALPTETFYGLAVDARNAKAVAAVNRVKGKPSGSPVLLLTADERQARALASSIPPYFEGLARAFWPGPLTLIVPSASSVPPEVTAGTGTVALRVPGLALPRLLAARAEHPLTGVSANRHGEPPARTASDVAAAFGEGIDLVLDGGPCPGGRPSTILDLCVEPPRVLREGILPWSALRPFLPDPSRA